MAKKGVPSTKADRSQSRPAPKSPGATKRADGGRGKARPTGGDSTPPDDERTRLIAIVEGSDDAIFAKSLEGTILTWNKGAERLFGYAAAEAIGQPVAMLSPPDRAGEVDRILRLIKEGGRVDHYETIRVRKDGSRVDVALSISPIKDSTGTVLEAATISRDITERKRAEEAQRWSETQLKVTLESIAEGILAVDNEGRVVKANRRFAELWRIPASVMASRDDRVLLSHVLDQLTDPDAFSRKVQSLYRSDAVSMDTLTFKDGRVFERVSSPMMNEGLVVGRVWSFRDITERKLAEEALRESELQFRALAETSGIGILIVQDGRLVYANPTAERLSGYTAEEFAGMQFWEVVHPDYRDLVRQRAAARLGGASDLPTSYEVKGLVKGGVERWFSLTSGATVLGGKPALVATIADITSEHRLREVQAAIHQISEATQTTRDLDDLFRSIHAIIDRLMNAKNLYIALHDPATNLISFPYFVDEVDARPEPFPFGRGMTSYVIRSGQPLLATPEVLADLEARGQIEPIGADSIDWLGVPLRVEDRIIGVMAVQSYAGNVRYRETDKEVLTYVSTQVAQAIERKQTERALREEQERFRGAFGLAATGMALVGLDGRWLKANRALCELLGYSEPELLAITFQDITHPDDLHNSVAQMHRLRDGEIRGYELEKRYIHKDGHVVWAFLATSLVRDSTGRPLHFVTHINDLTERKRTEKALLESEERYRMLFRRAPVGVLQYDTDLRITDCNDAFVDILKSGRERLIGLDMHALIDTRVLPALREALQGGLGEYDGPYEATTGAGEPFVSMRTAPLHREDGAIVGAIAIVEDMTEHNRLEDQLRQSQKMEVVGNLAGGVAHDFNNLLQAMLSHAQLLTRQPDDSERVLGVVRELEQQINRGASLTRQLLLFSRRDTVKLEHLDLNDGVREATQILQRLVPANIALAIEMAPDALPVEADRGQLQQVLMNLTLNASDAMPEGGRLIIRTFAGTGDQVVLSVTDTGQGIPEAIRERIFEPFFTTKEPGRGTGLGLSVVHGIVSGHGGRIEMQSAVGTGSTFTVTLPKAPSGQIAVVPPVPRPTLEVSLGNGERILVVEDEDGAREGLRDILTSLGYRVAATGSGEDARELPAGEPFDLLLTDLMLPGVMGPQVARELRERWPALKVILMSGYTEDEAVRRGVTAGNVRFLQKPFDMEALSREVRAALDE